MARQRHVYPTNEIAHLWAHQTQSDARNAQGNLYFRDSTLFSYRDSFVIAKIHTAPNGEKLVLINSDSYSNTTAKHIRSAAMAVSHMQHMRVDYPAVLTADMAHGKNLDGLLSIATENLIKAKRAMQSSNVNWRQGKARQAISDYNAYRAFFRIKSKAPAAVFPQADWDAAMARAVRIESPDPASADKRQREAAKRKAQKELQESLAVDCWRTNWRLMGAFGSIPLPTKRGHYYLPSNYRACMLRINGEDIETSQGARIPISHAPIIWRAVERVIHSGVEYVKNGHTLHAGNYAVDRIEPDGTMHAGCHTIPHSELRSMARQLGLST